MIKTQNTARNIDFRSTVEARRPLNRPSVLSTPDNYANDASKRRLISRWRISIVVESRLCVILESSPCLICALEKVT